MKGKGAQYNPANPFHKNHVDIVHDEGIDEYIQEERPSTQWFLETPKSVLSKNDSPDLKWDYSVNPYQGCEHGCTYCYARNSHAYWGFSSGLDFESKIVIKQNAPERLEERLRQKNWKVQPIMLSGNTDCYQPAEKTHKITRSLLKVLLKYRNPVSVITKNALILRDTDLLQELAVKGLVHVYISLTSMDDKLRRLMEPRTSTGVNRIKAINSLTLANVPVGVMVAPIIPALNHAEIPELLKQAAEAGAVDAGYTVVRLNGQVVDVFEDWLKRFYPDRFDKVMNQIKELHGGKANDSDWSRRLKGDGHMADIIHQLFTRSKARFLNNRHMPPYNYDLFRRGGTMSLFDS